MSKRSFQVKSMTGYGRGQSVSAHTTFTIEIQSVNRRYLEINISLPRLLSRFEMPIRKMVAERVQRGMVNVGVSIQREEGAPVSVMPNLALARGVKQAWEKIAYDLGLEAPFDLSLLAQEKELFFFEEEVPEEKTFHPALKEALDQLLEMKGQEGEVLAQDLDKRAHALQQMIEKIALLAPSVAEKYREKLSARLEELAGGTEHEERLLREVALYAERVDVTEECVRFKSHLDQLQKVLKTPQQTHGKGLDFLLQELNREINTIGSKGSDLTITKEVVSAKGELEKMREQVQNIE